MKIKKDIKIFTKAPRFRDFPGKAGGRGFPAFIFPDYEYPDSDMFPGIPNYDCSPPQGLSEPRRGSAVFFRYAYCP
jgi:hypothetical protein